MIGIDIIRKKRKTAGTGGGSVGSGISTPSGGDAQNAVHADDADHANRADEAAHAASAKELDGTSSVWNTIRTWISGATDGLKDMFLRKDHDDTTAHKLTMGEAEVTGDATIDKNLNVGGNADVGGDATVQGKAEVGNGLSVKGLAEVDGNVTAWGDINLLDNDNDPKNNILGARSVQSKGFDEANKEHGRGFGMVEKDGAGKIYTDFLHVRNKAYFEELETRVLSRVGGDYLFTKAGSKIVYVEAHNKAKEVITDNSTDKSVDFYRCYYLQDDGTTQTMNNWSVGDFARCQVTNIKEGVSQHASNRYYTRLVIAVSTVPEVVSAFGDNDTKKYGRVDLAANAVNEFTVTVGGETFSYTCKDSIDLGDGNDAPMAEDAIVQIGNALAQDTEHTNGAFKERGNVLLLSATSGGIYIYNGINVPEKKDMSGFMSQQIDTERVRFRSDLFQVAPWAAPTASATLFCMRGAYDKNATYGSGDVVLYGGQLWCCTSATVIRGEAPSAGSGSWSLYVAKGEQGIPGETQVYTIEAVGTRHGESSTDNDAASIMVNGTALPVRNFRGHYCFFLRGKDKPEVAASVDFDTYTAEDPSSTAVSDMVSLLTGDGLTQYGDCVLVIVSMDALTVVSSIREALKAYGYGGDGLLYDIENDRTAFVFIGQKGMQAGTAHYMMSKENVSLSASVVGGVLTGKGQKGDDGSTYDVYLSASVLKGDSTGKLNSDDQVSVTAKVVKITNGTATQVTNTKEAYFTISRTETGGDIVSYSRGNESEFTVETFEAWGSYVKTWNFSLYVGGVFLKTVTLPILKDGAPGTSTPGTDATVYTIEPCANFEATGKLTDASHVTVSISGDVQVYKTIGDQKTLCGTGDGVYAEYFRLSIGGTNYDGKDTFTYDGGNIKVSKNIPYEVGKDKNNVPGSATITLYDLISGGTVGNQLASLVVPVSLNPGAIVDVNSELGTIQNTTTSMQNAVDGMKGTIETIKQGQGQISLKVQDLQNGGIDTGKPHTSSQVDFTTLSSDNFYPVMIKFKNDDGVRHTVEIDRPLNGTYGSGKGYMTHGQGFSFRLVFSDIANAWGSYEDGQLHIESISQRCTTPSDTPICPKIAQYYPFSFMVVWLRGGSKYDITVDCTDAFISGIWPYMMQVASNPSWVPDAVWLANDTWTTAQINAQAGNPYNLLKHDDGGFYADTTNEYLYRFGSLSAGHTFAIVGQPTDSKQWFMATWNITSVSGSKVYVDVSSYGILWQAQNPLGIRMDGVLGYIKTGASYAKSIWDSQDGFGTSENIDNTAVHAYWFTPRAILVIGTESGTGRDRAVLESVNSCSEGSSVSFSANTYFDVSPLYGTDGRANVKTDMMATGIDIKSHKIIATTDNFVVRNNGGHQTFSIDKDGNIVGKGNATFSGFINATGGNFSGTVTSATINGGTLNGADINGSVINSTSSDNQNSTKIEGGQLTTNNISATGGNISFFTFDGAGMYSGSLEQDGKIYSGLGMSMNNLSVSGNTNLRLSSVFLGSGWKDSRYTNSDNYTVHRVGSTYLASTFYNYIKLERIGPGPFTYENDPEHAALGIETQGDFCLVALGGPSQFAGMCFASNSGSTFTGDKQHTFYLCSGGTFTMPSDPPDGMLIVVIQTGSKITFSTSNDHKFRVGSNFRTSATSNSAGQWTLFYFDGYYWNAAILHDKLF